MGRRNSFILGAIGVLFITSLVKAQDPSGTPGIDYPNYFTLPETSFKCSDQQYNPGFYADIETKCQAFHFCYQDRMESFLCPTGTIFNQAVLTCDVWYKSNCSLAGMFYSVNAGPVMERAGKNLPMLLRLRNRSGKKSSVQTSTASVSDKESSIHKSDNETPSEASVISKVNELKVETNDNPIDSSLKDFDNGNNEQMVFDSPEDFNPEKDAREETKFTNDVDEEMDASIIYDGVNDGYYKQYDNEWQDTEPESRDFKNFFDYREQHEYDARKPQLNDYTNNESFENSYRTIEDQKYPEFTKRSSQTGRTRVRRKPVYVLDDQPEIKAEEMAEKSSFEFDISNSGLRKGKEMNLGFEYTETETPRPTPFPRPTAIPSHLLNIPTATPMSSEAFEQAILSEIAFPDRSDWTGEDVLTLEHQQSDQGYSQSDMSNSGLRKGKEMNLGFEYTETETPRPTPFPRPTAIPSHLLNIPTATPMSSEAFEQAILSEIAFPDRSDWTGEEVFTLDYQQSDQGYSQSEETYSQSRDIQRDEDIYIENDIEHDSYVPYNSQHEAVVPESGEEAYSDTEDAFVIIPDEYDNVADSDLQDYPEDVEYRTELLADQSLVPGYDAYDSYSSHVHYPQYYEQANYPEQTYQMRENYRPYERYAYESSYEFPSQSMIYENSNFDTDEAYAQTELYPYGQTRLSVTEEPVPLPVTEADLVNFSNDFDEVEDSEQDLIELESEVNKPEDVYYILDFDEEQTNQGNETSASKIDEKMQLQEPVAVKSEQVKDQNSVVEQLHSSNESSVRNESSDNENEQSEKLTKTDAGSWPSNSLSTSDNEYVEPENIKSDINTDSSILANSNSKYASQHIPPVHESLASTNTPFSSKMGSLDFSSDSRFFNGMGYSESMDFGPYGFGPNMGQQFNMMESMQSQAASPFSQRISPAEQPKLSSLSAIQEKMRSMKQGKFGAFKKYMSSTGQ